jgi:hypothetical protein
MKNYHSSGRNISLRLFTKRGMKVTVVMPTTYNILTNILVSSLATYVSEIIVDFGIIDQHLI